MAEYAPEYNGYANDQVHGCLFMCDECVEDASWCILECAELFGEPEALAAVLVGNTTLDPLPIVTYEEPIPCEDPVAAE
jgi:hypothetical protein